MKNGKIELLRFMFCVCIVLQHTLNFLKRPVFTKGNLGVEFFFFVSGYLMANTVYKKTECAENLGTETAQFIGRKIKAIMPDFLIAYVIAIAVLSCGVWKVFTLKAFLLQAAKTVWEPLQLTMAGFGNTRANGVDWYISAMLIAMFVLYPFFRKHTDLFTKVVGPLLAIFLYGYMYAHAKTPTGVHAAMFFGKRGLFRAIAGLSLGAAMYPIAANFSKSELTKFSKLLVSAAEILCYAGFLSYCIYVRRSGSDFQIVLLIAIGVLLSFSHQGIFAKAFDNRICYFLGALSLDMYLSHGFWGRYISVVCTKLPAREKLHLYLGLTLATTLVLYGISRLVELIVRKYDIKKIFLKTQ